jgi:membrane protein required for colicin V production
MNWLDIVLIIPIAWGLYKGFSKGLVVEAGTIIALIGGIYCAINFSSYVSDYLKDHFGWTSHYLHIASLVLTFLLVVILVFILARLITAGIDATALTPANKLLGAVFGGLKFAFIFSLILFFMAGFEARTTIIPLSVKQNSFLYHPVASIAPNIIPGLRFGI